MPFAPERIGPEAHKRLERAFCACVGVFSVVGIAVPMASARALEVTYFINIFIYAIVRILELLIDFLGTFVTMLVDMVISVSLYNSFVSAAPVQAGWPLVRDVVNMLFIIVLLITAFSTIIQYKKFDYKTVLPKLLLMAVLVNFSKTLIGLLIDFSQVMMLTFVNGFKAAAAGGFVTAFKLDGVLKWAHDVDLSQNISNDNPLLVKILLAEMLGIFMLGTMAVTLLIMGVYLIARVVGLWIALIFSPAAFFALAIESTPLSKGLAFISGNFWPRLGALLSGGPIMAFFLWLALGTVQTGGFGDFSGSAARTASLNSEVTGAIQFFSNSVGNTQEIATFLVAVIMLLMGVEAAVSISGQVSSTLGKATGRIRDVGMRATRLASYGALAGAGAFATRRVGGGIARGIDSRTDLTGKVGGALQRFGGIVPVPLGGRSIQAAGGKLRGVRTEQRVKEQKAMQAAQANMHTDEQIAALEKTVNSGNKDRRRASQLDLAKLQSSKEGMKVMKKRFVEEGEKKGLKAGTPENEAYAEQTARVAAGNRMKEIEEDAKHDADLKKLYDETTETNPDYILDEKDENGVVLNSKKFADNMEGMASKTDAKGLANRISMKAYSDPRTADWVMKNTDILDKDGKFNKDSQYYKAFVEGKGARGALFQKRLDDLHAATPDGNVKAALAASGTLGSIAPGFYVKGEGNTWNHVNKEVLVSGGKASSVDRREREINAARERINRTRIGAGDAALGGDGERIVRDAQFNGTLAGGRLDELYAVDQSGAFTRNDDRANFRENTRVLADQKIETNAYARLEVAPFEKNSSERNEARTIFAAESNVGKMTESWKWANEPQANGVPRDAVASKNIVRAAQVIHDEGSRVQEVIERHNHENPGDHVDAERVMDLALANDERGLADAISSITDRGGNLTMDEAKALAKKREIDSDKNLREVVRRRASPRVARAVTPPPPPRMPRSAASPPPYVPPQSPPLPPPVRPPPSGTPRP